MNKRVGERLSKLEKTMDVLMQKFTRIKEMVKSAGLDLTVKIGELASKQTVAELACNDKITEISKETDSKIGTSEARCEEKIIELGEKCREAVDKALAIELRLNDLSVEWPTPSEGWSQATNKRNERRRSAVAKQGQSFAAKFKNKAKDTVVLVGDSLARGVGARLEVQSNMVSTICKPGARIEDITTDVSKLVDKEDRHLVLL